MSVIRQTVEERLLEAYPGINDVLAPSPASDSDKTESSDILAATDRGVLRIKDVDQDGLFDGVHELVVDVLGESTSDLAAVSGALHEICVSDVKVGTPYDSLRRYASLYRHAGMSGAGEFSEQLAPAGTSPAERLARLEAIENSYYLAGSGCAGVTVNERAFADEGERLYANLRGEVLRIRSEVFNGIYFARSPDELELAQNNLDRTWTLYSFFGGTLEEIAACVDWPLAYAELANQALQGFKRNAAKDSETAREYLNLYHRFCGIEPSLRKIPDSEINKIWKDAARKNISEPADVGGDPIGSGANAGGVLFEMPVMQNEVDEMN